MTKLRGHNILIKHIDINQIKNNIINAAEKSGSKVMAVVKANCYSNGLQIANFIEDYVCSFAVANVFEGIKLRQIGVKKPILSLSFCKSESELCKAYNISVSLSLPKNYVSGLKYHIAIDSGMNRSGVKDKENLYSLLELMRPNEVEGVYSHIFSANSILTSSQIDKFADFANCVKIYNSDALTHIFATNYNNYQGNLKTDMVRLGIGLYDNAVGVTSEIVQIKDVKKGESIGYDGEFVASKPMQVALCSGGYYDGIIRRFTGRNMGYNTDFCKVLGKISMDSHIIDITDKNAKIGDKTVIYDTDMLSFDKRADEMNISEYELMTALKGRFEYVYYY